MMRWCMPVELSRDWLANLLTQCDELGFRHDFEVEVLSYGHLPLAYSARCFTARSGEPRQDECETCCIKYPQGPHDALAGATTGVRAQRHSDHERLLLNLGNELPSMQGLVDIVRLSPQGAETLAQIDAFRANERGEKPWL